MKKMVAALTTSIILAGSIVSSASAEKYEVKLGDNLWDIAAENNTTVDRLVEMNELKSKVIRPKQKLIISETYTVVKGDTLSEIGKTFDVSVKDIKDWNDLTSDLIVIGQTLELKGVNVPGSEQAKEAVAEISNTKPKAVQPQQQTAKATAKTTSEAPKGKTLTVKATAYTAKCDGCSGITYTGINLNKNPNAKVIAVDPTVIPLGTEVYVEGYGYATAADIGGAIKGNRIDIHVPTKGEANKWGVRTVKVTIIK